MTSSARWLRVISIAALLLICSMPASAQSQGGAKEGGFVGVSFLPNFKFEGLTFDGEGAYQLEGAEEIIILPKLEKGPMFRGILGYRARKASLEVSYDRAQLDGAFGDLPVEATFQSVNVDGRFFFLDSTRVQPHVLFGGSFPWLRVKDGSILDPDTLETGDARYRGLGINTEVGVTVYPHPRLGISGGYTYRLIWFDRATGVSDTFGELRPRFREKVKSFIITATLVL